MDGKVEWKLLARFFLDDELCGVASSSEIIVKTAASHIKIIQIGEGKIDSWENLKEHFHIFIIKFYVLDWGGWKHFYVFVDDFIIVSGFLKCLPRFRWWYQTSSSI